MLRSQVNATDADPIDTWSGRRADGRDLISDWTADKRTRGASFSVVQSSEELRGVDYGETDFLLGIFANGHLPMEYARDKGEKGPPSLEEMTVAALKVLRRNEKGFLLVVSWKGRFLYLFWGGISRGIEFNRYVSFLKNAWKLQIRLNGILGVMPKKKQGNSYVIFSSISRFLCSVG